MTRLRANVQVLQELGSAVANISDLCWTRLAPTGNGLRIGPQVRHVLEFYQCFLDGLHQGEIDYDGRGRNLLLENSRTAALSALRSVCDQLEDLTELDAGRVLTVRDDCAVMQSTAGRELGCLLNHTIHHMALIAVALKAFGISVDPAFGVAPSTLRYREKASGAAA